MTELLERFAVPTSAEQSLIEEKFWGIVTPFAEEFGFAAVLSEELNTWQKVAHATNDVVTPANLIDVAGFATSMYGLSNIDSWRGIIAAASGLMTDVLDGKVARATGTQSPLGEAIDAGGDKVKLAYAVYKLWQLDLAPRPLIATIAAQNGLNAVLTAIDRKTNEKPVLHPSQFGKKALFIEQFGLGLHVIGSELAKTNAKRGRAVKFAGTVIGAAGVVVGGVASAGYISDLRSNSRKKR